MVREKLSRSEIISKFRTREIIEAAIELVKREGMERLTMDRLAAQAGVAKGTLYLYFKDKGELLMSAVAHVLDLVIADFEAEEAADGTVRELMFKLLGILDRYSKTYDVLFAAGHHIAEEVTDASKCEAMSGLRDRFLRVLDIVTGMFGRAMERGEIVKADARLLALIFLKSSHAMLVKQIYDPHEDEYADAKFLVEMILNGISLNKD
jgi:TetR/AcrR family transcriptional regulator